jgi:hypothetical protein
MAHLKLHDQIFQVSCLVESLDGSGVLHQDKYSLSENIAPSPSLSLPSCYPMLVCHVFFYMTSFLYNLGRGFMRGYRAVSAYKGQVTF